MLQCESVVKVVKEMSLHCGGEWFDIKASLPHVEAVTPYFGSEGIIFMDEDNLLPLPLPRR